MKFVFWFLMSVFSVGPWARAEIRQANSMGDLIPSIVPGAVVVFDLDNTVFEPVQTLGSDQFFSYLVKLAEQRGQMGPGAVQWALQQATPIQPLTRVRPVEWQTPAFIRALQGQSITVFALTSRPPQWAPGTIQQLASLGIDFSRTAPTLRPAFNGPTGVIGQSGVFFLPAGGNKGAALREILSRSQLHTPVLLFVDDKLNNVQSVDAALMGTGIRNINFRYGAADREVANFSPQLAEFEWKFFLDRHVFLPDEVARQLMK